MWNIFRVKFSSIFSSKGVPTISRAIINIKDKNDDRGKKGDKELLVEGYGLQKCMTTEGLQDTLLDLYLVTLTYS